MAKKNEISILDVTVRDGSYAINYRYTPVQVAAIAGALDRAGIDYIEVSHGCGLGAGENIGLPAAASDAEYVRAAKGAAKRAKIGVIAGPSPVTQPRNIDAVIRSVDFIRFGANCDDPRRIEANVAYALKLRPDLPLFLQLMRSTRRPKKEIVAAGRQAEAMGIRVIYVVDTAGHFLPDEVGDITAALVAKLSIGVGFHGHDNLGMAVANTLAAIEAGATSVDASLKGIGRAGGNAQLECLVSLLKRRGLAKAVDLPGLIDAGERIVAPIMPPCRGVAAIDLITADANIDLYPVAGYQQMASEAGISLDGLIAALGKDASIVEAKPDDARRALEKMRPASRKAPPRARRR